MSPVDEARLQPSSVGVNIHTAMGDVHIHNTQQKQKPRQHYEPETIQILAGKYIMGHKIEPGIPDHETPEHTVDLPSFAIGRYLVTNPQYLAFIQANRKQVVPHHWRLRQPPVGLLDHPVSGVSWLDAQAYCAWLREQTGRHYRLPSEAEWEKAARGCRGYLYPWGMQWQENHCNAAGNGTTPVNQYPQGASEYGCDDLLGNVQEWTLTCWGADSQKSDYPYPYDAFDGREDCSSEFAFYVHRGGCWKNKADTLRCTARGYSKADSRVPWRGFRIALTDGH